MCYKMAGLQQCKKKIGTQLHNYLPGTICAKKAFEGARKKFTVRGRMAETINYAHDLVLVVKEGETIQDMLNWLMETGRSYGIVLSV